MFCKINSMKDLVKLWTIEEHQEAKDTMGRKDFPRCEVEMFIIGCHMPWSCLQKQYAKWLLSNYQLSYDV
ncbi:hypothetical protein C5167_030397 [Papaver somniferum]|nr:hypothetical protein C5167_030397 [Papaver somniferum]